MKNFSLKEPSSKISNSSLSDNLQADKSKSTTFIENKISKITKSFITSSHSTSTNVSHTNDSYNLRYGGTFLKRDYLFKSTFTKNHITEFNEEESLSSKDDKDHHQMITFSMTITKHSLLSNEFTPMTFKESFEVSSCEKLKKAIVLFMRIVNKTIKDKGVKLVIPKMNMLNNNEFQVKPMKKSGKPDFDLPAFDIELPIRNICSSCFALVFKEKYLMTIGNHNEQSQSQSEYDSSKSRSEIRKSKGECLSLIENKEKKKEKENEKEIETNLVKKMDKDSCCNKCLVF